MSNEIYTATGCSRCKIAKRFLQKNNIAYDEFDFKAEGKDAFTRFYRTNRNSIFRDKDGVEFPVFTDGNVIRQGVSIIIGYLVAEDKLDGFIGRSTLHGEWINGFDISGGDSAQVENLIAVLSYLKSAGLKVQVITNGKNAVVLEKIITNDLCDRVIMEVKGPVECYSQLIGQEIDANELMQSIKLCASAAEYSFFTTISPLKRDGDQIAYLTSEEIGETAKLIEETTGSKKHPYELRRFDPRGSSDDRFRSIECLVSTALFKYRTAARRYQVMTEIEK